MTTSTPHETAAAAGAESGLVVVSNRLPFTVKVSRGRARLGQ
jgi:hypothetical protein